MSSVEFIDSLDGLATLRDEWNALAERCRAPLLDHDWCMSCAETLHGDQPLGVATIREAGALEGVAPLVVESTAWGPRLTLLGAARLYEPGGWLYSSERILTQLANAVTELGPPLLLLRVPAESAICAVLPRITRHRGVTVVRATAPSLAVPTKGSWTEYYGRLSSRVTSNLPRVQRKGEQRLGPMEIARFSPDPEETHALLDTFVAVEDSGWKGRQGSSLKRQPDLHEFFRRYCRRAAARRRLRMTTLSFGGRVAAVELALEACGRHWQLKIGYLDEFAAYYPGLQLIKGSIRAAFDAGLEAYEFLGSAASWEQPWQPEVREYRTIACYPLSVVGMKIACGDVASAVRRRARARTDLNPQVAELRS
jgi:CelD/BcsL family acetyltransferase involved in cellulose biosynthesis